jgi:hypothetical protein
MLCNSTLAIRKNELSNLENQRTTWQFQLTENFTLTVH